MSQDWKDSKVIRAGWLRKSGPTKADNDKGGGKRMWSLAAHSVRRKMKRYGGYQKRFFVLNDTTLLYYKSSDRKGDPKGMIPLNTILSVTECTREDAPPHAFDMVTDVRSFTLAAETALSASAWCGLLNQRLTSVGPRVRTTSNSKLKKAKAKHGAVSLESRQLDPTARSAGTSEKVGKVLGALNNVIGRLRSSEGGTAAGDSSPAGKQKKGRMRQRRVSMVFTAPPVDELAEPEAPLPRWAHVTGNVPRSRLSMFSGQRLQHFPVMSPSLDFVHRHAPWVAIKPSPPPKVAGLGFGMPQELPSLGQQQAQAQLGDMVWARHLEAAGVKLAPAQGYLAGIEQELEELLRHLQLVNLAPRSKLCRCGEPAREFFLLLQGTVRVFSGEVNEAAAMMAGSSPSEKGNWVDVDAVAGPAVLGLNSMLTSTTHDTTVATVTGCHVAIFTLEALHYMQTVHPNAAGGLALLASMGAPLHMLSCIPCLAAAFSNNLERELAGAGTSGSPSTAAGSAAAAAAGVRERPASVAVATSRRRSSLPDLSSAQSRGRSTSDGPAPVVRAALWEGPASSSDRTALLSAAPASPAASPTDHVGLSVSTVSPARKAVESEQWHHRGLHAALCSLMRCIQLDTGHVLFNDSDIGTCCYVIAQGSIALSARDHKGRDQQLCVLSRGDCVGERGLVFPSKRRMKATALTRVILFRLTHSSLFKALAHLPILWRTICLAVERRSAAALAKLPLFKVLTTGQSNAAELLNILSDLFETHLIAARPGSSSSSHTPIDRKSSRRSFDTFAAARPPAESMGSLGSFTFDSGEGGGVSFEGSDMPRSPVKRPRGDSTAAASDGEGDGEGEEESKGELLKQASKSSLASARSLRSRISSRHEDLAAMAGLDTDPCGILEQRELSTSECENLLMVASGCAEVVSNASQAKGLPPASRMQYFPGEFIGAGSVLTEHHSAQVHRVKPGAGAARSVVMSLRTARIEAWAELAATPTRRLPLWRMRQTFHTIEY